MPSIPLSEEKKQQITELLKQGKSKRYISKYLGVSTGSVTNVRKLLGIAEDFTKFGKSTGTKFTPVDSNKKVGQVNWRELCSVAEDMQELRHKASWSQDYASIKLGDGTTPVILLGFGDTHIGSYGANYKEFVRITDEIINTPNLYVALMGDLLEMAIKLRGVLEVTEQILTPELQEAALEDWLDEIKNKVAFATWDNHAIIRQESQAGSSNVKRILSRRFVYHNGIGHSDIIVGKQIYKCAASHRFRGGSMFNRLHAQGRYVRQEASDRELVFQGDTHTWGYAHTEDGGLERVYINNGTLHENSGYAKRFFSLKTAPYYPCVVLHPDEHLMQPFLSVTRALRYINGK